MSDLFHLEQQQGDGSPHLPCWHYIHGRLLIWKAQHTGLSSPWRLGSIGHSGKNGAPP